MHMLETPQQVQVWYVIPAIRRHMAVDMIAMGLKQKEIAAKLDITESAVSQYLKNKRAKAVKFNETERNGIRDSVAGIVSGKSSFNSEVQRLLQGMLQDMSMCSICQEHTGLQKSCRACFS